MSVYTINQFNNNDENLGISFNYKVLNQIDDKNFITTQEKINTQINKIENIISQESRHQQTDNQQIDIQQPILHPVQPLPDTTPPPEEPFPTVITNCFEFDTSPTGYINIIENSTTPTDGPIGNNTLYTTYNYLSYGIYGWNPYSMPSISQTITNEINVPFTKGFLSRGSHSNFNKQTWFISMYGSVNTLNNNNGKTWIYAKIYKYNNGNQTLVGTSTNGYISSTENSNIRMSIKIEQDIIMTSYNDRILCKLFLNSENTEPATFTFNFGGTANKTIIIIPQLPISQTTTTSSNNSNMNNFITNYQSIVMNTLNNTNNNETVVMNTLNNTNNNETVVMNTLSYSTTNNSENNQNDINQNDYVNFIQTSNDDYKSTLSIKKDDIYNDKEMSSSSDLIRSDLVGITFTNLVNSNDYNNLKLQLESVKEIQQIDTIKEPQQLEPVKEDAINNDNTLYKYILLGLGTTIILSMSYYIYNNFI